MVMTPKTGRREPFRRKNLQFSFAVFGPIFLSFKALKSPEKVGFF